MGGKDYWSIVVNTETHRKGRRGCQVNTPSDSTLIQNKRSKLESSLESLPTPPWHGSQHVLDLEEDIGLPLDCNGHNMLMAALPHSWCPEQTAWHGGKSQGLGTGRAGVTFQPDLWPLTGWVFLLSALSFTISEMRQMDQMMFTSLRFWKLMVLWQLVCVEGPVMLAGRSGLGKKPSRQETGKTWCAKAKTELRATRGYTTGLHVPPDDPLSPPRGLSPPPDSISGVKTWSPEQDRS